MNSQTRRLLLAAAVVGLVTRAGFGLIYWHDKPMTHDERQYLSLATNLAAGRGFVESLPGAPPDNAQQFGRAPLYPLFLAPLTLTSPDLRQDRLPADVPVAVKLAQAVVGAIGVWFIGALAYRTAGDRAGITAATVAAIYPPLVWICAYALSEALYSTLALACVYVLGGVLDTKSKTPSPPTPSPPVPRERGRGGILKAGPGPAPLSHEQAHADHPQAVQRRGASGQASAPGEHEQAHADHPQAVQRHGASGQASAPGEVDASGRDSVATPELVAEGELVAWRRVFTGGMLAGLAILTRPAMLFFLPFEVLLAWRRRRALAVWLVVGMLVMVLPWTVRNAIAYGRVVLVASEGGVTFWTGNHPEAQGEGDLAANPRLAELNREFRMRYRDLTEEELESIYYREALGFIASDPIRWVGLVGRKLFYTWVPIGPSYRLHSPRYFWVSVMAYGLVLPFAVAGILRLWRSGRQPWSLWWLAGSAVFVCLAFFPQERFRIPVIDPTLIVCAAAMASTSTARRAQLEIT